jgi:hypothetical protein
MNQRSNKEKTSIEGLSLRAKIAFVISLVIISIFPLFITFAPGEWPLQPGAIQLDVTYLIILAGYVLVLSGWYRPKWLVITMTVISALGVLAMALIFLFLATFRMSSW